MDLSPLTSPQRARPTVHAPVPGRRMVSDCKQRFLPPLFSILISCHFIPQPLDTVGNSSRVERSVWVGGVELDAID
jgi:hypothetical protein